MKYIALLLMTVAAVWGLAAEAPAQETGPGTVAGVIEVEKARVNTRGPKSYKDVVIYLEPLVASEYPPPAEHAVMDQRGLVFIPHVLATQKGATVDFLNSDHDRHNVYFLYDETGETLDIGTWGPGQKVSYAFQNTGVVITLCQLHLEMAAYIVVLQYPFFTVAEIDGDTQRANFEIRGLPPGEYTLKAWHKKLKMKPEAVPVSVAAGKTSTANVVITNEKYAR